MNTFHYFTIKADEQIYRIRNLINQKHQYQTEILTENENYSNPGFSMSDTNPDPIKFFSGDVALQIRTDDIYLYLMILRNNILQSSPIYLIRCGIK